MKKNKAKLFTTTLAVGAFCLLGPALVFANPENVSGKGDAKAVKSATELEAVFKKMEPIKVAPKVVGLWKEKNGRTFFRIEHFMYKKSPILRNAELSLKKIRRLPNGIRRELNPFRRGEEITVSNLPHGTYVEMFNITPIEQEPVAFPDFGPSLADFNKLERTPELILNPSKTENAKKWKQLAFIVELVKDYLHAAQAFSEQVLNMPQFIPWQFPPLPEFEVYQNISAQVILAGDGFLDHAQNTVILHRQALQCLAMGADSGDCKKMAELIDGMARMLNEEQASMVRAVQEETTPSVVANKEAESPMAKRLKATVGLNPLTMLGILFSNKTTADAETAFAEQDKEMPSLGKAIRHAVTTKQKILLKQELDSIHSDGLNQDVHVEKRTQEIRKPLADLRGAIYENSNTNQVDRVLGNMLRTGKMTSSELVNRISYQMLAASFKSATGDMSNSANKRIANPYFGVTKYPPMETEVRNVEKNQ